MKNEIHLVIIWLYATEYLEQVLSDLAGSFAIKDVFRVQWSSQQYSNNLTRFYGENLPDGSEKETHVGRGAFHAIILSDDHPKYELRNTSKGMASVNVNIFDAKQKYRTLTGGGHKIHATNSPEEASHDIWLLLGRDTSTFQTEAEWDGVIKNWDQDLIGASGWRSIEDLFKTLNRICKYVVLRNFEPLPSEYHLENHGDIDLLVDNLQACIYAANATKVFPESYRIHYYVYIDDKPIPFDFRYVGDRYYDKTLQKELLAKRELHKECFFAPSADLYFYTLLYHALIHKPELTKDYASRLITLAASIGVNFDGSVEGGARILSRFLFKNGQIITKPLDQSVYFNSRIAKEVNAHRPPIPSRLPKILATAKDLSLFSPELRREWLDNETRYHLSPSRANILRPFEALIKGRDVLEIGAECGAITRYLGEQARSVVSIEVNSECRALASARTRDLDNVEILEGDIDTLDSSRKYGVITVIGSLEYARFFSEEESPAAVLLARLRSLLDPTGILIIAIENQLGLKYFSGAPEESSEQPMYGIEGRCGNGQLQAFGLKGLANILRVSGFTASKYFAPFPDYKLPLSIVTESGLKHKGFDAAAFAWQNVRRDPALPEYSNFSMELVWPQIFENGIGLDLANSFLAIASPEAESLIDTAVLAYHYSTERVPEYCKETLFTASSPGRIDVLYKKLSAAIPIRKDDGWVEFNCPVGATYFLGEPLSADFIKIITRDDWAVDELGAFLERYILVLENLSQCTLLDEGKILKGATIPGRFFDATPQNIIINSSGEAAIIDTEWVSYQPVELGYLLYRACIWTAASITRLGMPRNGCHYTRQQFVEAIFDVASVGVTHDDYLRYISFESRVQKQVNGSSRQTLEHFLDQSMQMYSADSRLVYLTRKASENEMQLGNLNQQLFEREKSIEELNRKMMENEAKFTDQVMENKAKFMSQIESLHLSISDLNRAVVEKDREIGGLTTSRSWKITAPLRYIGSIARKIFPRRRP